MKTIGIIGGLGPPSTVKYYEWLNDGVQRALGKNHGARILISSVDGQDVHGFRDAGDAAGEGAFFAQHAQRLETAGADFLVIASNTSHKNAPYIERAVKIPLLHLADATAAAVKAAGMARVGFLGTPIAMESDFYRARLTHAGLDALIPADAATRAEMGRIIYDELSKNIVTPAAADFYRAAIRDLCARGATGVILGCTELTLFNLDAREFGVPLFDTVRIHVDAALKVMLSDAA